jgi:hypothetical protein
MLNKILRAAVKAGLLSFCLVSPAFSAVTRYPAPRPIRLSSDYTILADGLPIDVHAASTHLGDGKQSRLGKGLHHKIASHRTVGTSIS